MPDFQRHTSTQQHTVGTEPNAKTDKFAEQTTDQRQTSNNMGGGVRNEYQQSSTHKTETEITHSKCPVSSQPIAYTEEARRLDLAKDALDHKIDQIDNKMERDDKFAKDKNAEIQKLGSEAEKAAKALNKDQEKHAKQQTKEQAKLQAQEEKTMKMAEKLAQQQAEQQRIESAKAQEALAKDAEARRLAGELVSKREKDRAFAEQKMHELELAEEKIKQKANELSNAQAREVHELEIKQKEMKVNVEVARKNMEELKRRHELEKQNLEKNQADLEKLRAEAKQARELEEKHINERMELEERIRELDQKAEQERLHANQLQGQHAHLQDQIAQQKKNIAQTGPALQDREHIVIKQQEQKKEVECHAKEQLKNEELALKKAEELAAKTEKERREAQEDLARLVGEEQAARQQAASLNKTGTVKVEEKPATIDVYQHKRYETTEPVVTEVNVGERMNEEHKSIGEKIIDGVKSIF